jgi:hypothetical protein
MDGKWSQNSFLLSSQFPNSNLSTYWFAMDGILDDFEDGWNPWQPRGWMESWLTSRMDGILEDFEDGWNLRRLLWVQVYDIKF